MNTKTYTVQTFTLSDRASQGVYDDVSGETIITILEAFAIEAGCKFQISSKILPDDTILLETELKRAINAGVHFIFTTGGTGIGPRDITPDVVKTMLTKEIPGIMEFIRMKYGMQFPAALLSRSVAGVAQNSIIYCLPGSPKAVKEYMAEILKTLLHCYKMLHGSDDHTNG